MSYESIKLELGQEEGRQRELQARIRREREKKPYEWVAARFLGSDEYGGHTYEITFNKSLVSTLNYDRMLDGLNYPRAKTWLGRVWNAIRNR